MFEGWKVSSSDSEGEHVEALALSHEQLEARMEETRMKNLVQTMSPIVKHFFSTVADHVAQETTFVQRTSKVTGSVFLKTFVFGLVDHATASLNDLAEFCADHVGVRISPQGLDERIHASTLRFMETMCTQAFAVLRQRVGLPIAVLQQFSAVNITDSTAIELPDALAAEFPGCGGDASSSSLKIQTVFEFLTGRFQRLWLTPGNTPDQSARQHVALAEPGSLNLFDLGYFGLDQLSALAKKEAYFLCRLFLSTTLAFPTGQPLDLLKFLRAETGARFDIAVYLGKQAKLPCRLCGFRASEEVANRRRHKAKKLAAKKGRQPTKSSLELMGWTLVVTNVPTAMVSLHQMGALYALRWQIELLFKLWKSHMKLHCLSGYRKERILVDLYAKLIGLILFHFLSMPLRTRELNLSLTKAFRRFVNHSRLLAEVLTSLRRLETVIHDLHEAILKFAKREKRNTRFSTCQHLFLEVDYYA